jgi:hypothetical protein
MIRIKQTPNGFRQFPDHLLLPVEEAFFKLRQQNEKDSGDKKQKGTQGRQGDTKQGPVS